MSAVGRLGNGARQVLVFAAFLVVLGLAYTGYKALGAAIDDAQSDWPVVGLVLPRSDDLNMPPLTDILGGLAEVPRGEEQTFGRFLLGEGLFTFREAFVGFLAGVAGGLALAVVMARSRWLAKGLLPYVIASQTVPLIAIAPLVVIWGRKGFEFLPWEWQDWMSVSVIATYLTFFPVAVNGLRGLTSPSAEDLELMRSYAASWTQTLFRLRFPASLPFLFAAFRIAATASVVGAIVGEISAGVDGGLGRRILLEAQRYTTSPERLYGAVLGAAALGVTVFVLVAGAERLALGRWGAAAGAGPGSAAGDGSAPAGPPEPAVAVAAAAP
jgi:NitT/TauT family transport system permease protein